MTSTIYERATVSDFLDIALLDRHAWKFNKKSEYIPDGEHAWRHWVEHALVYTAKESGKIIGAILAFPCIDDTWCIHKVFVEKDSRGCGIGRKLLEVLLVKIDELDVSCFLTVDPINNIAIKLYEDLGFSEKIFVSDYYRKNENRYVLTRYAKSI